MLGGMQAAWLKSPGFAARSGSMLFSSNSPHETRSNTGFKLSVVVSAFVLTLFSTHKLPGVLQPACHQFVLARASAPRDLAWTTGDGMDPRIHGHCEFVELSKDGLFFFPSLLFVF